MLGGVGHMLVDHVMMSRAGVAQHRRWRPPKFEVEIQGRKIILGCYWRSTVVSGVGIAHCRCVAGGLGGMWLVFNTLLRQIKKEEN